jgi:hypothetical protein
MKHLSELCAEGVSSKLKISELWTPQHLGCILEWRGPVTYLSHLLNLCASLLIESDEGNLGFCLCLVKRIKFQADRSNPGNKNKCKSKRSFIILKE